MRTEATFLISAALIHAVALPLMARFAPPSDLLGKARQELRPIEIDVTTVPLDLPRVTPQSVPVEPPPPEPAAREPVPGSEEPPPDARPRAVPGERQRGPEQPESNVPVPQPTAPPSEYGGVAPEAPGSILNGPPGIGGPPIYNIPNVLQPGGPPPPAPTVAPKARPTDKDIAGKLINESLREKDKAIGIDLPAAGSVASAIQTAVMASNTPNDAKASFEIRLSASGQVLGVRVIGSNAGDSAAWKRAADAAAASLAGRTLAMSGEYARGAIVTVSISSVTQAPSGNGSGLDGAGARFDLSNIGAHKRRVVRVSHSVRPVR